METSVREGKVKAKITDEVASFVDKDHLIAGVKWQLAHNDTEYLKCIRGFMVQQ